MRSVQTRVLGARKSRDQAGRHQKVWRTYRHKQKKQADEQTVGGEATPMCQSVYAADTKSKQDSKMIRIQNTELIK